MKEELKNWFQIDLDTIEEDKELFANIQKAIEKLNDIEMANKYEIILNNNLIEVKDKYTNFRTILGCRVSYDNLDKNISFIVRKDNKPTYEELEDKINKQKEVLDKIKEFCNEQIKLANIEIDECCRWRNADKEKYIITETNLSKAFLIKKCNKRILRVMDLVENGKYYNAKQIYEKELLEEIE